MYDALSETGEYLVKAYGFKQSEHEQYMKKSSSFENEYITDDVTRVARSPLRKLGANDRLVVVKIKEPNALAEGIAAALRFDYQDDPEAVELQKLIAEKGTSGVLQDICGIQPHEPLHGIVLKSSINKMNPRRGRGFFCVIMRGKGGCVMNQKLLPHRFPFLLIDGTTNSEAGKWAGAYKTSVKMTGL